jgi:hypothetical protein
MHGAAGDPANPLRDRIERWFVAQGVPRLVEGYSVENWLPVLASLVFVVLAYQMAAAPLLGLDPRDVVLAPAVAILFALPAGPVLRAAFDPGALRIALTRKEIAWRLTPLGAAAGVLLALSDHWASFAVLLLALVASAILLQRNVRTAEAAQHEARRRRLSMVVVVSVIVFALEGLPIKPIGIEALGALPISGPSSLSALPCLGLILFLSLKVSRATAQASEGTPALRASTPMLDAAPVLVLVLGIETAVLPGAVPSWVAGVGPLALVGLVVAAFSIASFPQRLHDESPCRDSASRILKDGSLPNWALALFASLYLLGYPILVWASAGIAMAGLAVAVNLVYLAIAWTVAFYGLDRVAAWAARDVVRSLSSVVGGLLRGLPLLLVFTVFLIMTTELWQAVHGMETASYLMLIGSLLALTALFLLITSLREIETHAEFATWKDVRDAAGCTAEGNATRGPVAREVGELLEEAQDVTMRTGVPRFELSRSARVNSLAVVAAYQALVFVPVTAAAFGFFLWVGNLAVKDKLLKNWVYGDNANPAQLPSFHREAFLAEPWTRVALFLAVFSLLYFAVSVLTNTELRRAFFAGADGALRQRFAVRVVYRDYYFSAPAPTPPRSESMGAWVRSRFQRLASPSRSSQSATAPAAEQQLAHSPLDQPVGQR